jgi:hypothetical protein
LPRITSIIFVIKFPLEVYTTIGEYYLQALFRVAPCRTKSPKNAILAQTVGSLLILNRSPERRRSKVNKWLKIGLIVVVVLLVILFAGLALVTRSLAIDIITLPPEERPPLVERPEDYGMVSEDVAVTTADELALYGWYIPGQNGATVMVQHGSPGGRQDGLFEAELLNRHGYNVLMGSYRAHDESDGELITFGYHELKDMAAWHQYLETQ